MKIEKLNEDKIRITLNIDDLKENNIDFHSFMSNSLESQELFTNMLNRAEKEVGFITENYRIMIEALAMSNGSFVLTITRLLEEKPKVSTYRKRNLNFKRKVPKLDADKVIYCFKCFEDFCQYCEFLQNDILQHIEHKLIEYGTIIFKDNAISNCLKHFC